MNEVALWKEVNSRLPSIKGAIHELFKSKDGSKSFAPVSEDPVSNISLFMEKSGNGKKGKTEYIDPSTKTITFSNDNGTLDVKIDKKKMRLSWDGKIDCAEDRHDVRCSISGSTGITAKFSDASDQKESFRLRPSVQKALKRKQQTREIDKFDVLDLWTEAKTNVRDINQIALIAGSAALGAGILSGFILPALGLLTLSSPMLVGAPLLANYETTVRNEKAEWYINGDMRDDKWINKLKIDPINIEKITIYQDDEFYFHTKIFMKEPVSCKIMEESDVISIFPERRLECSV